MAGDLLFSVGIDATPLDVGVAKVEQRLEAAGVKFAEVPTKYANASAKAFEEIFSAEEKLARYRQDEAFRRMSNEEKLSVLRQQAFSILTKAQEIEGQSAEKSNLLLQYEQKKTAIFDINQKIQAQSLAEQKEQTDQVDQQGKKYTGLTGTLELIKKGFKDIGVSIQGAGIGVAFAALISMGKQAINNAQEQRDLYERMRQPLDANTASLAKFGDALDMAKKGAVSLVGYVVSGYTLIGETIGSAINRMRGIDEAQEKLNESTEREAKYQEEKLKKLKQEQYDREKIRDIAKENAEAARKYAYDALNDEQQWSALVQRNIALRQQINDLQRSGHADSVKFQQLQKELIEQNTALRAKDLQLVKETADKQIAAINIVAPLAITQAEKMNILKAQERTLQIQLQQEKEKGFKTDETSSKLQALAVQQVMLQREYTEKIAFDNERVLEIVRIQYKEKTKGLTEVEAAVLRMYRDQTKERENQMKIDELILVKRQRGLTPEEQKSLDILLKQEKTIEKQLGYAQANLDTAIKRKNEEDLTVTPLEKQLKKLQEQGVSSEQIVATLIGRGAKERDILAVLEAQTSEIGKQFAIRRTGTEYEGQSDTALQGVISRLKQQIADIERNEFGKPGGVGGKAKPLEWYGLQAELFNAQKALEERMTIRNYANLRGEDAARFKYGDTDTDQALRAVQSEVTKQRVTMEQLLKSFNESVASLKK